MEELFTDTSWVDMVTHLLATLVQYFLSLPRLPWQPDVPDESLKDVARFSLLGLEVRFQNTLVNLHSLYILHLFNCAVL